MLRGRDGRSGRKTLVLCLESHDAAQPEALEDRARGKLGALDRKPEEVVLLGLLPGDKVPGECDDVEPGDGAEREDGSLNDIAHEHCLLIPRFVRSGTRRERC